MEERNYLTLEELALIWRPMSIDEQERAAACIGIVTSELRIKADNVGKELDRLADDPDYARVLKSVIADVVARVLMTSTNSEPMSQMSQAAGGYSVSGTFLVPGGGVFIKRSELSRLGLRRQKWGALDVFNA